MDTAQKAKAPRFSALAEIILESEVAAKEIARMPKTRLPFLAVR
jgi:hypothetical protein